MLKSLAVILAWATGVAVSGASQTAAPPPTPAASTPAATPLKLATIHVQNAIMRTREGQKASEELQAKFASRRKSLEQQQASLAALQQQMRAGSATMNAAAKDRVTRDIDARTTNLRRESEDYDSDVQQEEGRIMNDLGQKMMAIIGQHATKNGIALVIDVSNPQSAVLWADASLDITAEIIKEYDEAHPVPAAPATAPPVSPAAKKP